MEDQQVEYKFADGQIVKCIATEEQLAEIRVFKSNIHLLLNKEITVRQYGVWSGKPYTGQPKYLSCFLLPESFLEEIKS